MSSPAGFDPGRPPALSGCLDACRRCERLVRALTSPASTGSRRAFEGIGPHLRHCLDHFTCLLRGLDAGIVDYDARDREEQLERDPQHALDCLDRILEGLNEIGSADIGRTLRVRQEAAPGQTLEVSTNLERELIFLSSHTIHHLAIMGLLAQAHGATVPDRLGVAFSTATHMERQGAADTP